METDLGPSCAHLRIGYLTETVEGLTRGWWQCEDCHHGFVPLILANQPDNSKVICPNCCNQFGATSVDDQKVYRELRELLKLVQSDAGNWLHSGLQKRIEAVVGEPGPYRDLNDDGTAPSASGGT